MSDDWKHGDLAVCVNDMGGDVELASTGIAIGKCYTVTDVFLGYDVETNEEAVSLAFAEISANPFGDGFHSELFRKIRPDEPEACEEEFRILLKLSKQRVHGLGGVE